MRTELPLHHRLRRLARLRPQVLDHQVTQTLNRLLLAEAPSGHDLHTAVRDLFPEKEVPHRFIYDVVRQLNQRLLPPITQMELVLTEGCNLACTYCFEKNFLGYRRMTLEVARTAIDLLFDYSAGAPGVHITHFGGEPLLNLPILKDATEYAEQRADELGKVVTFGMTSNGTLLTEKTVDYLADHRIKVLLSLDGMRESNDRFRVDKKGRGTFEQVRRGLEILRKRQPYVGVKMTVMPENARRLPADIESLWQMGVRHFIIGHATGVHWSPTAASDLADAWAEAYRWYLQHRGGGLEIDAFENVRDDSAWLGCQAGRSSVSVTVDGELSPCSKVLALNKKQLLGKLGDVSVGITHLRNRMELVGTPRLKSACEAAGILDEYQGGCFACNYEETGDLYTPNLAEHRLSSRLRETCVGCTACG